MPTPAASTSVDFLHAELARLQVTYTFAGSPRISDTMRGIRPATGQAEPSFAIAFEGPPTE